MSDVEVIELDASDVVVVSADEAALVIGTAVGPGVQRLDHLSDVDGASDGAVGEVLTLQSDGQYRPSPASGSTSSIDLRRTALAAEALSGHRIVTELPDGTVGYASSDDLADLHAPLWLTLGAATLGGSVDLLLLGSATEGSWSWTPGPVYLGANGALTQSPPTGSPALFLAQVGVATSSTTLYLDRQPSVALI